MPRPRAVALLAVPLLTLAARSTDVEGQGFPAGAALEVVADVDTGYDGTGNTDRVVATMLDSAGEAVAVTSGAGVDSTIRLVRYGTGDEAVPVAAATGTISAAAIAPDDTVVMLGDAETPGVIGTSAVIRVAPDGTETAVPLQLSDADPITSLSSTGIVFTPDASRVLLPDIPVSYDQGFPELQGILQLSMVDTTSGVSTGYLGIRFSDPVADVPGTTPPVTLGPVALAPDGSGAVTVTLADGSWQLLRFDTAFQLVGDPVQLGTGSGWISTDAAGTVYAVDAVPVGEDIAGAPVLAVRAGSTEVETVGQVPAGVFQFAGMVADRAGTFLYLAGTSDLTDAGDFPMQVRAIDLASGAASSPVQLCAEGYLDPPRLTPDGAGVLIAAECNDAGLLQDRVYVLQP
ncbi:hypothetical protein SAMN03159343_3411 [Klenkia marina]|uniref:Uncharacterized protein n=1 Tax=Klenkia marina TaxID=1960309 RepID=A0A1G4YSK2_9ACTN|nr:hypothetical protein [Klenkia marina]SCX56423.1 hypothetical protein SAMN03159343_3411 [Klenkia marina]